MEATPKPPVVPLAPLEGKAEADAVLDRFIEAMAARGLELYEEQEEAILELFGGRHVILNTPTGSGKSLVAAALLYKALCAGERAVYTCPIKALVNEKFLSLCRDHGPDNVGLMTGDATVNEDAPILCCTAEILANIALCGGSRAEIAAVVMDEFHYYGDPDRGAAWQIPLLCMPRTQFLLMSATLPETRFYETELERMTSREAVTVKSDRRPVPLRFSYSEEPVLEEVQGLLEAGKAPIYLVYFTQRAATEAAQQFVSLQVASREERDRLGAAIEGVRFNSPFGKDIRRWLRSGIGVHHAGLLPKYRVLVESLAQKGLLKVICGTDTLGVGINVPIRTVVFTQLWKYDGQKSAVLRVRDFRQIAGRAGRRGFDDEGDVVAMAPEHVIENKRAEAKAAADPKKKKKLVKKTPPKGQVGWDEQTYEKLQSAPPEGLTPQFDVSHGMLLQVLSREEDGCRVMRDLIRDAHVTEHRKGVLRRRAWQLFRALLERKIVELRKPSPSGRKLQVNVELQADFSLHQALSLYLLDTLPRFEPEAPDFALDVLTLCESIVEDPDLILRRQVDRLKTEELARLKADGVPYEERMNKLDAIEHPKPLREFLYETFNVFREAHPWVEKENVRPKSIAREMYERYMGFSEYVREYGLARAEGVLLRHLAQVYKVLAQTVPDGLKTEAVFEMEHYLRELIYATDSSLVDEWERLRDPDYVPGVVEDKPVRPQTLDWTREPVGFQRRVRAAIFEVLRAVFIADWEMALERLDNEGLEAAELEAAFAPFFEARESFRLDPEGRAAKHSHFEEDRPEGLCHVAQMLVDPEGCNDWEARFTVLLDPSRREDRVALVFEAVEEL
ncbi:MAG: DEAD/DEAH box helicase [Opitutales bacterium]